MTEVCAICGRPAEAVHHLIFGVGLRELAEADGLTIPICNACHNCGPDSIHGNAVSEQLSKMIGQEIYEKRRTERGEPVEMARAAFRKRYGRSWL